MKMRRLAVVGASSSDNIAAETFEPPPKFAISLFFRGFHRRTHFFVAGFLPNIHSLLALSDCLSNARRQISTRFLGERMRPGLERVRAPEAIEQAGAHQQCRE